MQFIKVDRQGVTSAMQMHSCNLQSYSKLEIVVLLLGRVRHVLALLN